MKKKPVTSPPASAPGADEHPYSAAIARHQSAQLNVSFTRSSLQVNVWQSVAIVGLLLSNFYFGWKAANPPLIVVASDHG
ncbi:hypothetical protein BZ335_23790, partial [Salmonella enterica subsp. enterica serovar Enteritidis]|nr:hypothetical protein [Salmonella enterica subsp. enterica serovar Enteritidis]